MYLTISPIRQTPRGLNPANSLKPQQTKMNTTFTGQKDIYQEMYEALRKLKTSNYASFKNPSIEDIYAAKIELFRENKGGYSSLRVKVQDPLALDSRGIGVELRGKLQVPNYVFDEEMNNPTFANLVIVNIRKLANEFLHKP